MSFSDLEKIMCINHVHYCLPVRWQHEGSWFEIKQFDFNDDTDTVSIFATKDDGVVTLIVMAKDNFCGDIPFTPDAVRQSIYDGLI